MRQYTLATALQALYEGTQNVQARVLRLARGDVDAPDYEQVSAGHDMMIQQLSAEARADIGAENEFAQNVTHYAFVTEGGDYGIGYRVEVTRKRNEDGSWHTIDAGREVYEIIGKEVVPELPSVRCQVRLSLTQVSPTL